MRSVCAMLVILTLGCGGGRQAAPSAPPPEQSATSVVMEFMQAVADSNLTRMAELWGTTRGSAAFTRNPPDYQRRIFVMHSFLKNGGHRVVSETDEEGRVAVMVELMRPGCVRNVPFGLIRSQGGGFLINTIDLDAAGNPLKPCGVNTRPGNPTVPNPPGR